MSDIAKRIEKRRKALGLSERAVERKAELGEGYIRNIKRGKSQDHLGSKFAALARALECSVIWLRTGKGDPSPSGDERYEERMREMLEMLDALDEDQQRAVHQVLRSYGVKPCKAG